MLGVLKTIVEAILNALLFWKKKPDVAPPHTPAPKSERERVGEWMRGRTKGRPGPTDSLGQRDADRPPLDGS